MGGKKQASESDLDMIQMLGLLGGKFKISMINNFKGLVGENDNMKA